MEELAEGTAEFLRIAVKDRLGGLDDLAGTSPRFDVDDPDGTRVISQAVASFVGMDAYCLVDTQGFAYGTYKLYLDFQLPPEFPRIGPFEFKVIA